MERRGPLVHRAVRFGSLALLGTAILLVLANILPALSYSGFSVTQTLVQSFGDSSQAPLAIVFDLLVAAFGIFLILGAWLIWSGFPARGSRTVGLLLLMITGLAAILLGAFPSGSPQNLVNLNGSAASALFVAAGLALLVLTLAMLRDRRWDGLRLYTLLSGIVVLVAFLLYHQGYNGALGPGGAERLAFAALTVWLFVIGTHLVRIPVYSGRFPTPTSS
ncbi:MAG: DUF998 domain-containing protein [Thermoplasmata archaeon]